jgi:hypothetical protein
MFWEHSQYKPLFESPSVPTLQTEHMVGHVRSVYTRLTESSELFIHSVLSLDTEESTCMDNYFHFQTAHLPYSYQVFNCLMLGELGHCNAQTASTDAVVKFFTDASKRSSAWFYSNSFCSALCVFQEIFCSALGLASVSLSVSVHLSSLDHVSSSGMSK